MAGDHISTNVRTILQSFGWTEGRQVDTSDCKRRLEETGFVVSDAAERFLSEFHGIHMDLRNGPVDFGVDKPLSWICKEDIPYINRIRNTLLCPVGYSGRCFVLISPSSEFVLLNDEWLFYILFHTLGEVLEGIVEPGKGTPIDLSPDQIPFEVD